MLNNEQLKVIRERWLGDEGSSRYRIARAEQDIPALLDTVEELRELLQAVYEYAESPFGNFEIHKKVDEALT